MIISVKELSSTPGSEPDGSKRERGKEWLIHEVLQSLANVSEDVQEGIKMKGSLNLQLMIDNEVVEPVLLMDMFTKTEKYIDAEAELRVKRIVDEKLLDIDRKFGEIFVPLEESIKSAKDKVYKEFDIVVYEE